jgi:hypothetical protein
VVHYPSSSWRCCMSTSDRALAGAARPAGLPGVFSTNFKPCAVEEVVEATHPTDLSVEARIRKQCWLARRGRRIEGDETGGGWEEKER